MMRLATVRDLIRALPERYRNQYKSSFYRGKGIFGSNKTYDQIQKELDSLDVENTSKNEVDKIMGNESWTRLDCSCCGKSVDKVVVLCSYSRSYNGDFAVCAECLKFANLMFK